MMFKVENSNKRIAKNTLFLYTRQMLVIAISLYTVRVVLQTLGEKTTVFTTQWEVSWRCLM